MKRFLMLVLLLLIPVVVCAQSGGALDCTNVYILEMRYTPINAGCSDEQSFLLVGPATPDRPTIEARRRQIFSDGYVWPCITIHCESDPDHIAPTDIHKLRVVRACCHYGPDIPLPEWWCIWPDGEPTPLQ